MRMQGSEVTLIVWQPIANGGTRRLEYVMASKQEAMRTARGMFNGLKTKIIGGDVAGHDIKSKWLGRSARGQHE